MSILVLTARESSHAGTAERQEQKCRFGEVFNNPKYFSANLKTIYFNGKGLQTSIIERFQTDGDKLKVHHTNDRNVLNDRNPANHTNVLNVPNACFLTFKTLQTITAVEPNERSERSER